MADTLEQLTKKLLDEQVAANNKAAADRKLQEIKDTNEIEKQNKILEKLDSKKIEKLQEKLAKAQKDSDDKAIKKIGKQLKDAGIDKFVEATSKIQSIEESQKFSKKVEAERSKDVQRIDAMKTSVERMKDEAIASGKDASKDRVIKDAEIKIRKEEFNLRVKNLEGTDLMAARLEELGNDLKDKGLDPEKNRKFQKESIKLQRAELRERLKNAETPSERIEILKEQSSKDRKALTLQQKTLLGINNLGKSLKETLMDKGASAIGGFFGLLKKAALIGFLIMLPKILNSQTAKDFVKKLEENMPVIKEGLLALGKFFLDTGIAIANVALILKDIFTGNFSAAFDRLKGNAKDAFDDNPDNPNSLIGKMTLILGAVGLIKLGLLLTKFRMLGGLVTGMIAKITGNVPETAGAGGGKKLTKANLKKEGLKFNKAGQVVDAKTGKFVDKARMQRAGFGTPDMPDDKMKKISKMGRIGKFLKKVPILGYVLSLGSIGMTVMDDSLSITEKAKRIGAELGGLAGAGVGAILGSAILPLGGTLLGGLAGYFAGEYIFTKLFEYLLGGTSEKQAVQGLSARKESRGTPTQSPPTFGSRGGSRGDLKKPNLVPQPTTTSSESGFTGTISGELSLALHEAIKSRDASEIKRIMDLIKSGGASAADGLTPNSYASGQMQGQIINQNIITDKRSNTSSYVNQNSTITPSYGMTTSVINSI